GDFTLEHQHETVIPRWPRLDRKPADKQYGCDVVGQIGDDPQWPLVEIRRWIEGDRVTRHDDKATRIVLCDFIQRGDGTIVALHRDDFARAAIEKRARKAAWPRPYLEHGRMFERACRACNARSEIQIEQKILAERFLCRQA